MRMRKTSASALISTTGTIDTPNIAISSVADSYKQNGPFGGALRSTLLSTIISIEPDTDVNVAPGKLKFCFAINDETANIGRESCQQVMNNAAVMYTNSTAIDAESKEYARCAMEFDAGGCFCCTFASHFSIYTVADIIATEASLDQQAINVQAVTSKVESDLGTNAATAIEADNQDGDVGTHVDSTIVGGSKIGGVAGGVFDGLCLVVAIAAVVAKKREDSHR
jgi:hypothetical protein